MGFTVRNFFAVRHVGVIAAGLAAWQPSTARAAEEDTQFWLNAIATGAIGEGTTLTIDATQRWRGESKVGADQQSIRATLEQRVAAKIRIGGGIMLLETAGLTEIRSHQQATFTLGRFESRTRLEQRLFDGAERIELRLRQRVMLTQPLARDWRASAGVEWLGILRSRKADQSSFTEQWRFQAALVHRVSKALDIGASYWLVSFPRGPRPERISHIPQAVVTFHF
jgi:hypothetical protein